MSLSVSSPPPFQIYTPHRNRRYAPQTPSPLRTSRNANLMPLQPTPSSTYKIDTDTRSSSLSNENLNSDSSNYSPSENLPTTVPISASTFQFQARSRSQSPQASLAKSNALSKVRRSNLFLDRVRNKREDARFETRGDQALRMEFVRERRAWEERLKKKAPVESGVGDSMDEDMEMENEAQNDMPSPTEDREIEELLSILETDQSQTQIGEPDGMAHNQEEASRKAGSDTMSDDEDYDQLFMEVIGDGGDSFVGGHTESETFQRFQQSQDSSMDLS